MNSGGFFADDEQDPDIAALPDGGFIMVYEDIVTANSNFSIRLLEFDANGSLVTSSETVANDPNNGAIPEYFNPTVTVGSATSILITYQSNEVVGGDSRIVGKIYNSVTNTYSAEIDLIDFPGINADSQVAVLNNGNFAIVSFSSGDSGQIALRMVNSVGNNVLGAPPAMQNLRRRSRRYRAAASSSVGPNPTAPTSTCCFSASMRQAPPSALPRWSMADLSPITMANPPWWHCRTAASSSSGTTTRTPPPAASASTPTATSSARPS
jgi:hypothetical protein